MEATFSLRVEILAPLWGKGRQIRRGGGRGGGRPGPEERSRAGGAALGGGWRGYGTRDEIRRPREIQPRLRRPSAGRDVDYQDEIR